MTLTKANIIDNLFKNLKINKRYIRKFIEIFFEEIKLSLESGHKIRVSGFGNFYLRDKKERLGRNPKTGICIPITARRVVTFRAGQKLKVEIAKAMKNNIKE